MTSLPRYYDVITPALLGASAYFDKIYETYSYLRTRSAPLSLPPKSLGSFVISEPGLRFTLGSLAQTIGDMASLAMVERAVRMVMV